MIEMMFVLTTVFVAYVVYSIAQEKQKIDKSAMLNEQPADSVAIGQKQDEAVSDSDAQNQATVPIAQTSVKSEQAPAIKAKAEPEPVAPVKPVADEAAKPIVQEPSSGNRASIRNPKTGEVAVLASNYRFMKRWIKEALVEEGLLDKIYKNNELDSAAETKIKQALGMLQDLENYRA